MRKFFNFKVECESEALYSISIFQIIWITYCQQILVIWNYKCGSTSADSFIQWSANLEIRRARSLNEQAFLKAVVGLDCEAGNTFHSSAFSTIVAQNTKVNHFPSPFSHLAQPYQIWQAFVNFLEVLFRKACNLGEFGSTEGPERNQLGSANSGVGVGGETVSKKRKPDWLQLCANPLSQSDSSIPDEGLCSRKIYPFPTQMSFPDQLLEGPAALNPRPPLRVPSSSARAGLSSPYKPPSKPCTKALHEDWPWPGPRPWKSLPHRVSRGPRLGGRGRLRVCAPGSAADSQDHRSLSVGGKDRLTLTLIS